MEKMDANFYLKPIAASFVAEVVDINLKKDLTEDQFLTLQKAINEHKVLIFRNQQEVDPTALRTFSKRWGALSKNGFTLTTKPVAPNAPFKEEVSGRDDMQIFENHENAAVGRGNVWHSDVSYKKNPPAYTILQAHIIPESGGDTLFMDMEKALEHLPEDLLAKIKNERAMHSGEAFIERLKKQLIENPVLTDYSETYHPLISRHPGTGKPVLFYNMDLVRKISGFSDEESDLIINAINDLLSNTDEIMYRHQWQVGDILMWDNRALMHYATFDYGKAARLMYRTTVEAEQPPQAMY